MSDDRQAVNGAELLSYVPKPEPFDLPDGRVCFVRIMTLAELERFERTWGKSRDGNIMARLIILGACDAEGRPLFDESQLSQVEALRSDIGVALSTRVLEINKMTKPTVDELKNGSGTTEGNG